MNTHSITSLLAALGLLFLLPASQCLPTDDDDDAIPEDDDDATDDDDAADDDDVTPLPDTVISGEVLAVDRATGQPLSDEEFLERSGGIVLYVLPDANDLSEIFTKVTMDAPGEYEVVLEEYAGAFDVVAVADWWQNSFIDNHDVPRAHPFNPLQADGTEHENVDVVIDLAPQPSGGGCPQCDTQTTITGEVAIVGGYAEGPIAVSTNTADLSNGPISRVLGDGSGPFSITEWDWRGPIALLGYLDDDGNGFFEPSDPIGEADINPVQLGLGDVSGALINIPSAGASAPAPSPFVGLEGTVNYAPFTTGDILLYAVHRTLDGYIFSQVTLAAPGAFALLAPPHTEDVLVYAVLDVDGDGMAVPGVDPSDTYGPFNSDSGVNGIDLDLETSPVPGSLSGTIDYDGAVGSGDVLYVGVFDTPTFDASSSDPVDLLDFSDPEFPVDYSFSILSGTYWIGSYLDVGGDNPTGAGPGDPTGNFGPFLVAPGEDVGGADGTLQ